MLQSGNLKRAVFLDRDGVINSAPVLNGLPYSPHNTEKLEIIAGVKDAVSLLFSKGYEVVVVTNQPDVAKGKLQQDDLNRIHEEISARTGLQHFFTCLHVDEDRCACRKPKPGLLLDAAAKLNLELKHSFLIGDRWKDIQAGQVVGCQCFFIDYNYVEMKPTQPFRKVASLMEAAMLITESQNAK